MTMTERNETKPSHRQTNFKPVEKTGFPPVPPKPAMNDLRFIVRESLRLGSRFIYELDRLLSSLKK